MKAVVQRVSRAQLSIDGAVRSRIGPGLVILLGVKTGDTGTDADYLAGKCGSMRIFEDEQGKMNLSVLDTGGSLLVVSQFTLYGDARKGNRPSFTEAAVPSVAEPLYDRFVGHARSLLGAERVQTGVFRATMELELVNSGPVTITIESRS